MNKQCHGWVISVERGVLVVVGEHVKRSRGFCGTSAHYSTCWLLSVFLSALVSVPTLAQIIPNHAVPASQQALIFNAANGVPIVNIQTPSGGGVSRNRYSQFDVRSQGVILNNAQGTTQTQLSGWILGNSLVAGRPAKVILNEVNSNDPSQLLGTIEVAGSKAQIVIANSSGITCNGCGFINATGVTLSTGEPRLSVNGVLEGYRVTRGQIRIEGQGMNASAVSTTDVIARAVQINAGLWANYLRMTLGTNEVNADNTQVMPIDLNLNEHNGSKSDSLALQPPVFALDVAAIGGMYANKIFLMGTEAGVGVRNAGLIGPYAGLGGGEIVLHANGLLENRGRIYGEHIALEAKSLVNTNPEGVAPVIAAGTRLDIAADTVKNNEHALLFSGGDIVVGEHLDGNHHATGQASLLENASATIEAQGHISIAANEINNTNQHFSTEVVEAAKENIVEYQGAGALERYREGTPDVYVFNQEIDKLHTPVNTYETWSRYQYQRTIDESRITHTDPAKMIAGGDIHITGESLLNDKSQIIAGGKLTGQLTQLINRDGEGVRTVLDKGVVTSHWRDRQKGRDNTGSSTVAYEPVKSRFSISLNAVSYEDNAVDRSSLHNNALFQVAPNPNSTTIIETDPAFTNHHQWLSSAYLLEQLAFDPATVQKRLGDGFYEQRLVREQVAQLTGRRFLEGYASDEEQYLALLNNGVTIAKAFQLRPGVALSAEQVAALTSDIVWLVEKDIALPSGEHTRALVPEVYARLRAGDMAPSGALLSGRDLSLMTKQTLTNSGQISAQQTLSLTGDKVRNLGGQIAGRSIAVDATTDIDNVGGQVKARDSLALHAGRDINVVSTTHTSDNATSRRTTVDRVASISVTGDQDKQEGEPGVLVAVAGRDIHLIAAAISNDAKPSVAKPSNAVETNNASTSFIAGNDIHLGVVTEDSANHIVWDKKNQRHDSQRSDVGTQIHTQGEIHMAAGHDVNLRAATVHSEQEGIHVTAQRNVVVAAGGSERHVDEVHEHTEHGMVSSTTRRERDVVHEQSVLASTLSGQTIDLQAGNDAWVTGSQVVSSAGTGIHADNNVTIEAATNTRQANHTYQEKTSGLMSSGGFGVTLGHRKQSETTSINTTTAAASTVGSIQGNVTVDAGHNLRQTGSHVITPVGDVSMRAQRIDINEARDTTQSQTDTRFEQTGITIAVSNPVVSAVQLAQHMSQAASNTHDPRMKALAAASTGLAAMSAADAVQAGQGQTINGKDNQIVTATDAQGKPTATKDANAADKLGGVTLSVSLGTAKSQSHSKQTVEQSTGSTVAAGGDVHLLAEGAGNESDIVIQASTVNAGGAVQLRAQDELTLRAAANTTEQTATNNSHSTSIGVGIELGAKGGVGVTLAGNLGRGKGNANDLSWQETQINAGHEAQLQSGNDTQLEGSAVTASKVSAEVGGHLTVTSLQDTSTYRNEQHSAGGSVTFGPKITGSVNLAASHVKSDYASVNQQAAIRAGDEGFNVEVKGNTTLNGGAITSTNKAVANDVNHFHTGGQVSTTDITNHANYSASASGVNIGVGTSSLGKYVPSGTSAGVGSDSGKSSSITRGGISGIAGDTNAHTDSSNKEVSVSLAKIFDANKVQKEINAQVAITQSFTYEASKTVSNYASTQRKSLQDQLLLAGNDLDKQNTIKKQLSDLNLQERVMNVLIGAVAGMGSAAAAKETLSAAAEEMRKLMIDDSKKFVGITDGKTVLTNDSGTSAGVRGDGKKLGGTRVDLDLLCGNDNSRCKTNLDGSLKINAEGLIEFKPEAARVNSLEEFLMTPDGKKMTGLTGGIQGAKGTLFGVPYSVGSWQDHLVEAFAGTHDMVGGSITGLYDEQGNATRNRSYVTKKAQDAWSASGAILVSSPFAVAELLTPQMWQAVSILLKEVR